MTRRLLGSLTVAALIGATDRKAAAMTSAPPEPDPVPPPTKPKKDDTSRPYHETN